MLLALSPFSSKFFSASTRAFWRTFFIFINKQLIFYKEKGLIYTPSRAATVKSSNSKSFYPLPAKSTFDL
jgi:hypothetical protein